MCIKLLILKKPNSHAKIAASFLAKVACKIYSFLMKNFSAKSVGDFFCKFLYFKSGWGNFLDLKQYSPMYDIF